MLYYLPLFFITAMGLAVGSFLNVVILRLHAGRDFVKGRSECPRCHHRLAWYDNIPLVSWIWLRGKCRSCHKPISWQYPVVELLTAGLFAAHYLVVPHGTLFEIMTAVLWLIVIGGFVVLAVYDLRWYLLPDKVLLPLIIPAMMIAAVSCLAAGSLWPLASSLAAGVVFGGFFYGLAAVSRGRWMGGGDIKLAFVMGLLLGLAKTAVAMLIAFNAAAIIGIALIVVGLRKRSNYIPFGPFLIAGTLVAYWFGVAIIDWYLGISGFDLLY